MYRCFSLTVQNGDFFDQPKEYIDECKRIGQTIKDSLQVKVNEILSAVTNPDGVIDGENLAETWFPVECMVSRVMKTIPSFWLILSIKYDIIL